MPAPRSKFRIFCSEFARRGSTLVDDAKTHMFSLSVVVWYVAESPLEVGQRKCSAAETDGGGNLLLSK